MTADTYEPVSTLDTEKLMSHVASDVELLSELVSMFREYYPNQLSNIRDAIEENNASRLQEMANQLKCAVSNFHSPAASCVAKEIEDAGRESRVDDASPLIQKLETEIDRMFVALDELCQ